METPEQILAKHPFFKGIAAEHIHAIAKHAKIEQCKEGDILFREGGDATKFYLVIKGKVAIETFTPHRGLMTIQTVEDGEMMGWSWLVPPFKYKFGARVVEKTELAVLDGENLRHHCDKNPALGYELLKRIVHVFTQRLEQTRLQVMDIYGTSLK